MRKIIFFTLAALVSPWLKNAKAETMRISAPILSGHFNAQGKGRSAAALEAVFKQCKILPDFVLGRWGQHWEAYEDDKSFDAVAIVWKNAGIEGFPSNAFIHQKNGVVFLAGSKLHIKTVQDLKGLRVLGFGGATRLFPSLAAAVPNLSSYWEAPSGFATTQALVNGDVDAFVTDGLIFAIDYTERAQKSGGHYGDKDWPKMKFIGLFPENGDIITFRRESDRDRFNGCLAEAQASGAIARATKPFIDPYRDIVDGQIPAQ